MKLLTGIAISALLLSGCAGSNYRYQTLNHPEQWQNKNISAVIKQWGLPSQAFHTRTGTSYYIYQTDSGGNFFNSTTTNFSANSDGGPNFMPLTGSPMTANALTCVTIFKTNSNNIITNVQHKGNNCGGEWVPKK